VIIGLVYPFSLQKALKEDSFAIIEQEQTRDVLQQADNFSLPSSDVGFIERQQAERSVGNILIVDGHGRLEGDLVPTNVMNKMKNNADDQSSKVGRYQLDYKGATVFYVIRKLDADPHSAYLISYMWDTYRNQMMKKLWNRLLYVLVLASILALAIAVWLTRYLKQPLDALGVRFEEIARLNWEKPFEWKSGDEFERLSTQFENMRRNLLRYDESQKHFLQQASHELKTPIMVIESYAQSVKDGIYPQGSLDDTMDIIIDEAAQMDKRVRKLLYFTRVDSLRDEKPILNTIAFGPIAEKVKESLAQPRPGLTVEISGHETPLHVDQEQWMIVLENLMENALRYAQKYIKLKAAIIDQHTQITIENDGLLIPEEELKEMFIPFKKGRKGQFGLGLAIVKRIVDRHDGSIEVKNQSNGVVFIVRLPYHDQQLLTKTKE
jgi:two-component system sensor histidine kinase CssS